MKVPYLEKVLEVHKKLIDLFGGSYGIRDISLLDSALNRINASMDGKDLYPDVYVKVSAITYSIINNHAMIDGNKRLGIAVMLIVLRINEINLDYSQSELIDLGLRIAQNVCNEDCISKWIKEHEI